VVPQGSACQGDGGAGQERAHPARDPRTTLLGALRVHKTEIDYRKQKLKEGVYTLRLAYQPADGDHMGTAPNAEFACRSRRGRTRTPS